ncbi:MAG: nuclear transport factor 2 family protein [Nanoarchaeota archaeon]
MRKIWILMLLLIMVTGCSNQAELNKQKNHEVVKNLVYKHAKAWENGDYELLDSVLHENVVFAYPGRRLNKAETFEDLIGYNKSFKDTRIYINELVVDGEDLAVEWQFASTNIQTGNRTAVSDAIIGKVKNGKIIVWKEYLDGRVSRLQMAGNLSLEEGEEPFPWPNKK